MHSASIDGLLDQAVEAINRGDRVTAAALAGQVLAVDGGNADAEDLLAAPAEDGEIRRLTILFVDVVDSTVLSNRVEPETYRLLVGRYRNLVLRRGAPDPAHHDQINFYGTCSFDVETELRREGHRPLTHQPPHLLAAGRRDQIRSATKASPDWQQQHRHRARQPKVKRTEADPITPCPPRTALPCCRQRDRGRLARRCELPALVAPGMRSRVTRRVRLRVQAIRRVQGRSRRPIPIGRAAGPDRR